jgi:RsiW-degrading membrane proteinase PrsW (M82 family)
VTDTLTRWVICIALGLAWVVFTQWRAPGGTLRAVARAALGGAAAFALSLLAYGLLQRAGLAPTWEEVVRGGAGAIGAAVLVGVVEEGAKLAGAALAGGEQRRRHEWDALRSVAGVSSAFAALEAGLTLVGVPWGLLAVRASLAPVVHTMLAAPMAPALAPGSRRVRLRRAGAGVAFAVWAHALGDWGIARGGAGLAVGALGAFLPTFWLFVRARRAVGWPMPWEQAAVALKRFRARAIGDADAG